MNWLYFLFFQIIRQEELARVDASKSIDCYRHEINWHLEEEVARDHINDLVRQTWKKVNVNRAYEDSVEFEHNRSQKKLHEWSKDPRTHSQDQKPDLEHQHQTQQFKGKTSTLLLLKWLQICQAS